MEGSIAAGKSRYVYRPRTEADSRVIERKRQEAFHSKVLGKSSAVAKPAPENTSGKKSETKYAKVISFDEAKKTIKTPTRSSIDKSLEAHVGRTDSNGVFRSKVLGNSNVVAKNKEQIKTYDPAEHVKHHDYARTDAEVDRIVDTISKNLEKQRESNVESIQTLSPAERREQERAAKRVLKKLEREEIAIRKREEKAIKKAQRDHTKYVLSSRYEPHTRRNFFQNLKNRSNFLYGDYDWVEEVDPATLSGKVKEEYWEDVDKLEDAMNFDSMLGKKLNAFRLGLAGVGLAVALTFFNHTMQTIVPPIQEAPLPTTIVTQVSDSHLNLEERRARSRFMKMEDQEYLYERINENFIPENMTEEQKLDLMQEAWENLEPDVQKWVREPERAHEAELKREAEEKIRLENEAEIEAARTALNQDGDTTERGEESTQTGNTKDDEESR